MMKPMTIAEDTRHIQRLVWDDGDFLQVGQFGVTDIVAYSEPGDMANVPWFAIYKGEFLYRRVNARTVSVVTYKEEITKPIPVVADER